MKSSVSLDDYALFLSIADSGSLSAAAQSTGISAPTYSRRIAEMERQLGKRLFERGAQGYTLTTEGVHLLRELDGLRAVQSQLRSYEIATTVPTVRITAGPWRSRFLAQNLTAYCPPDAGWLPEFLPSHAKLDLARREADIGIRNREPDQNWLAARKTTRVQYAPFGTASGRAGWITQPKSANPPPSQRWVHTHHAQTITTTTADMRMALDLALAGAGQVVLPTFAAAAHPELLQKGPLIADLAHDEWLVSHHNARHDAPIRAALDAILDTLTAAARPGVG